MKGPFQNNRVYAIASTAKYGVAGGVLPAVYAFDRRTATPMFFTIGEDEIEDGDVYETRLDQDLRMDSGVDAGWKVPDRQVLSLWSDREAALAQHSARSQRAKKALETKQRHEAEALAAARQAEEAARASTAEGRLEAIPGVDYVSRIMRGDRDIVMFAMKLKPDTFRKIALALGIDQGLVEEWLVESEQKIREEKL